MNNTHPLARPMPRRQIDTMEGDDYIITAVATRDASFFPGCQCHDITIQKIGYSKALVIHAQGIAPVVNAEVKRKRMTDGFAIIWADAEGKVIGGGFTTGAVPRDWRVPAKPKADVKTAAPIEGTA